MKVTILSCLLVISTTLFGQAKFTLDVTGTVFRLTKDVQGSLIYTTDGLLPTEKPTLIAGSSLSKVATANQKQYCIDRLKSLPRGELIKVTSINPIQVDNLPGYEIIATGRNKDSKEELVYQVMVFTNTGGYFIIIGKSTENTDDYLKSFKTITKTLRQK
jgi:hypothetical protein